MLIIEKNSNMFEKERTGADYIGLQGTSGYSGAVGPTGNTGISGYSGLGSSGYSGYSSYSGISGYSGIIGAEGIPGTSGYSGYSGIVGLTTTVPVGTIIAVSMSTVPDGFLECDGSWKSTDTYPALYSYLGNYYGYSAPWFAVPDYRGLFLRGWTHGKTTGLHEPDDATRTKVTTTGATMVAGNYVGTEQDHIVEAHTHTYVEIYGNAAHSINDINFYSNNRVSATGSYGGNETRPMNTYVMYCIKY